MTKVAVTLSGGGFRATAYHLGVLSYLYHLKLSDGRSFLDIVSTISTISGGTLTGLWYMNNLCKGIDTGESLRQLYKRMMEVDIFSKTTDEFFDPKNPNTSLIKEMTRIYDELFFNGDTFGNILDGINKVPVEHYFSNATDFTHSLQFRFQANQSKSNEKTRPAMKANNKMNIPYNIASQIHLSEIFAASSCFPGGFEPLMYPTDFNFAKKQENEEYTNKLTPMGLMDGGVLDNQGVEPVLLVDGRKNEDVDLIVVGDAGRGGSPSYQYELSDDLKGWSIHRVNVTMNCMILFLAQFLLWVPKGFCFGLFFGLTLVALVLRVISALLSRKYIKRGVASLPFKLDWKQVLKVRFNKLIDFVMTRGKSLVLLEDHVFMKHIRTLNYASIWEDDSWFNRRIMNALYELRPGENWVGKIPEEDKVFMTPTGKVQQNSLTAASMGTTLWFSDEDRAADKPNALVSTGQYNTCWNLLEYIIRAKAEPGNTTEAHNIIMECEQQLREDWKKFQDDPQWLFKEKIKN